MHNIQKFQSEKQPEIIRLSDQDLLSQTKILVQKERNLHIQILHHLREIESRKLYFSQGFSSLFDYAVKELGYSEGAAYRRIKAMRLCRDMPETESRLQSGRLSLSSACQLQSFFEKQAKKLTQEKFSYEVITQTNNVCQEGNVKISEKADSVDGIQQIKNSKNSQFQNSPKHLKNCSSSSLVLVENKSVKPLSFEQNHK